VRRPIRCPGRGQRPGAHEVQGHSISAPLHPPRHGANGRAARPSRARPAVPSPASQPMPLRPDGGGGQGGLARLPAAAGAAWPGAPVPPPAGADAMCRTRPRAPGADGAGREVRRRPSTCGHPASRSPRARFPPSRRAAPGRGAPGRGNRRSAAQAGPEDAWSEGRPRARLREAPGGQRHEHAPYVLARRLRVQRPAWPAGEAEGAPVRLNARLPRSNGPPAPGRCRLPRSGGAPGEGWGATDKAQLRGGSAQVLPRAAS